MLQYFISASKAWAQLSEVYESSQFRRTVTWQIKTFLGDIQH